MKNIIFSVLICLATVVAGCKKSDWTDWKVQNRAWLAENQNKDSVQTTPTGLQYKVIRQGIKSVKPDELKSVRVNYTGSLITGNVFEQKTNASLSVGSVITGLAEGLKKMNVSGHYIFYIPEDLGYGEEGAGGKGGASYIPPYSTLVFDVELIEVY